MGGFVPDLKDADYVAQLKARMQDRLDYVTKLDTAEGGLTACLPTLLKPFVR